MLRPDLCARHRRRHHASIAAALRPDASVAAVCDTALAYADYHAQHDTPYARYDSVRREVERALEIAARHVGDPMGMLPEFDALYYGGTHMVYAMSQANEVVCKGLAIFYASEGDARTALLAAVNYGRDTDCVAAVTAGLAGAYSGASALDVAWIEQVNAATAADPYTNSYRDIDATADGAGDGAQGHRGTPRPCRLDGERSGVAGKVGQLQALFDGNHRVEQHRVVGAPLAASVQSGQPCQRGGIVQPHGEAVDARRRGGVQRHLMGIDDDLARRPARGGPRAAGRPGVDLATHLALGIDQMHKNRQVARLGVQRLPVEGQRQRLAGR